MGVYSFVFSWRWSLWLKQNSSGRSPLFLKKNEKYLRVVKKDIKRPEVWLEVILKYVKICKLNYETISIEILSDPTSFFKFSIFCISVVFR